MTPGRLGKFLLGMALVLAAGKASAQPGQPSENCVTVSEVSVSVPCPCVPGESGITLGFTLTNAGFNTGSALAVPPDWCPPSPPSLVTMAIGFLWPVLDPGILEPSGNGALIGIVAAQSRYETVLDVCDWEEAAGNLVQQVSVGGIPVNWDPLFDVIDTPDMWDFETCV
eukprot:g1559.t1